jgi:hypothetical protein
MLDQALCIKRHTSFKPVFLLADPGLLGYRGICQGHGIEVVGLAEEHGSHSSAPRPHAGSVRRTAAPFTRLLLHDRIAHSLPVSLVRMLLTCWDMKARYKKLYDLCHTYNPFAICMTGDRELGFVQPLLRVGLDLNIPTIISLPASPQADGQVLVRQAHHRFHVAPGRRPPLLNRVAVRTYPEQVRHTKYGPLLFSPGWLILALKSLGMYPDNPWVTGCGNSRFIMVDGEWSRQQYIASGVPEHKIKIVGDLSYDALYAAWQNRGDIRERLFATYGLRRDRPLLIFSVPSMAEQNILPWHAHWQQIHGLLKVLAECDANVLLSLHPKCAYARYAHLEHKFGFPICRERLYHLLPAADLFITHYSSTVQWAILCHIPVIICDLSHAKIGTYSGFEGVVAEPYSVDRFQRTLLDIVHNTERHQALVAAQRRAAAQLAAFDGTSNQRFIALLESIHDGTLH